MTSSNLSNNIHYISFAHVHSSTSAKPPKLCCCDKGLLTGVTTAASTDKQSQSECCKNAIKAAQHQLLTELMEHQQLVIEHGADFKDMKQYFAVPVSVLEQKRKAIK